MTCMNYRWNARRARRDPGSEVAIGRRRPSKKAPTRKTIAQRLTVCGPVVRMTLRIRNVTLTRYLLLMFSTHNNYNIVTYNIVVCCNKHCIAHDRVRKFFDHVGAYRTTYFRIGFWFHGIFITAPSFVSYELQFVFFLPMFHVRVFLFVI